MMTHLCEHCRRSSPDLVYLKTEDEYWCYSCLNDLDGQARAIQEETNADDQ